MLDAAEGPILSPAQRKALTLSEPLPPDRNPAAVYLATLSEGSRRTMRGALNRVARLLGLEPVETEGRKVTCHYFRWARLRPDHVAEIRSRLLKEYAPATVNKHLSAVRGTLKAAYRLRQMDVEDYQRAVAVESVSTQHEPSGRLLKKAEIDGLLKSCERDATPAGARDAAMIALWAVAGPKRAEIVNLNVRDYERETGAVSIRARRGQQKRTVYVSDGPKDAMDDWMRARGESEGPLFVPIHHSGKVRISRMTPQAAYNIVRKRARQAGIPNVSPHDLRRTALSNLIDETDLSTAQRIAGHADPRTTARYDVRGNGGGDQVGAVMSASYREHS